MVIKFIALNVLIFSTITKYVIQSLAPNALYTGHACSQLEEECIYTMLLKRT